MNVATINQAIRCGYKRWRRFIPLWFVIWLIGCVLIVVAFSDRSLLTGGSDLSGELSPSSAPAGIHMRF